MKMRGNRFGLAGLFMLVSGAAAAQQPEPRTPVPQVSVVGESSVMREPDQAMLSIAVETAERTAQLAAQGNAAKMTALIAAVKAAGIPAVDVRTISYSLN